VAGGRRRLEMLSDARGLAALVLAGGVAIAIIAIAVGAAVHSGPISAEESTLIATVLGAAVGALATFLGFHNGGEHHPEPEEHDQLPPPPYRSQP
jgi:hypothetical protein